MNRKQSKLLNLKNNLIQEKQNRKIREKSITKSSTKRSSLKIYSILRNFVV